MNKRQIYRLFRLATALAVAGFASWRNPSVALVKFWRAATFWARFVRKHERAAFWTTYRRYRACRACPVFDAKRRTCGSPFGEDASLGCFCHMESKCGIADAQCWLIENELADSAEFEQLRQRWGHP